MTARLSCLADGLAILEVPHGTDGRYSVSIDVTEIAAVRAHVVTSYAYVDYSEITLKNSGKTYDCPVKASEVRELLERAANHRAAARAFDNGSAGPA